MLEDLHYRREDVIDVDAAVVGISRLRWESATPEEAQEPERVRVKMEARRFDVLPVDESGAEVSSYFVTKEWGDYSAVEQREITYDDVIPQSTPLPAVVRRFAEGRRFFFLANERRVTGLISVVNLNCRQARIYLFALLCDLEVRLGELVQAEVGRSLSTEDVLSEAKKEVRERYEADRQQDVEREVVEYLYLPDLLKLVRKRDLQGALGYESKSGFEKEFNRLVKLRNAVAHPAQSLVRTADAAEKLWRDILVIERALFQVRQRKSQDGARKST
jgi:hypothetical protein